VAEPVTTPVATPDTPIEALMQQWAITRNAVKKRARELEVELLRPDRHSCLWPGDALELGHQLDHHLKAGKPVATFPGLPRATEATSVTAPVTTSVAALARRSAPVTTSVTAPEQMAALVAALRPADPMAVPEALARAADAGHWLSSAELAAVLGLAGIPSGWCDDHRLRPGYSLERQQERPGGERWWRVKRSQ